MTTDLYPATSDEAPRPDHERPVEPRDPSWIASVATTASRRWRITMALLLVVLAAGSWAFAVGLDREGFPPVNTPISIVTGTYLVDDAELVDADVAAPLEAELATVDGVIATSAQSQPSTFVVVVEFEGDISSEEGTQRLVDAGVELPDAAQVDYRALDAASFLGEYDLIVSVVGQPGADPEELQAQASTLAGALADDAAVEQAVVRDLVSEAVDPATGESVERLTRYTRVALDDAGYLPGVAIGVVQDPASDADVLEFSDTIDGVLADATLSDGVRAEITADFANGVRAQLDSLSSNLLTGLLAVAVVSLLLIGWRAAVITSGFMVVVMVGALGLLRAVGYTLNTITLFGLILTLGLLVDDAIVISESIDANRDDPDPSEPERRLGVIRTALTRVGSASLAGTLTTVVVFSPLLFVGGILGSFIRPIPATVILTLVASFLFSIVFIPLAARLFLLRGPAGRGPIVRSMAGMARAAGRLAGLPARSGFAARAVGVGLAGLAVVAVLGGGMLASGLGFAIFPAGKDALSLNVTAEFPPGTTIEAAQDVADEVDAVVLDVLGDDLVRSQYIRGNERVVEAFIDLTPIDSRDTTAPEFVTAITAGVADIDGARITVGQSEVGPPVEEFPFAAQVLVADDTAAAGQRLAEDIEVFLQDRTVDLGATDVTVVETLVATDGQVARTDTDRYVEVRAQYDDDSSVTSALTSTRDLVDEEFGPTLPERGLDAEALVFDFGQESDNQDDFAALGVAGLVAIALMLVLLAVQFRSVAQSLLIFLAIPFSFLGVFSVLAATDNPLSFLVVVGFIALIGVAVNNTILLVEAANRARTAGATAGAAIQEAVERRFRPLVATTLTTVVGLLPLTLSDPFWESLGFTLIGGLLSSTLLVLVSFPVFYLGLEAIRTPLRNAVRRRRGRPLVT